MISGTPIRIALVDDHTLVRDGIRALLMQLTINYVKIALTHTTKVKTKQVIVHYLV